MHSARCEMAAELGSCQSVLDVGCGAGGSTAAIHAAGAKEVVGLDASPYMLVHARRRNPGLTFVQGLVEDTRLPEQSYDGIGACFLFHELPPKFADAALRELKRLLKPGGHLVILEPAREQYFEGPFSLLRFGWRGPYYWLLARFVNEPFAGLWHKREVESWLKDHGFKLKEDRLLFPSRLIVAELV
jgi:ubiquinone/menaquinone biosynthesis C-methylase UbiE